MYTYITIKAPSTVTYNNDDCVKEQHLRLSGVNPLTPACKVCISNLHSTTSSNPPDPLAA